MKMILAIMPTTLSELVSKTLLDSQYRVTKFASTAGFLAGGTTTLMVGLDADKVEKGLTLIREQIPASEETDSAHARVTIYVLNVSNFDRV
ncbi:MAG: hypothetical protein BA863_17165 [Desulfovibrio sp. S3730MH75]|nr:MAG: hypothetical protein BA863_17165 [Desulfovibrio sp. S3730MH75]